MRLLQANKILLASCVVVVPLSFYGGLALKEYFLEKELPKVERDEIKYRADRARIAQLQQERGGLLDESRNLDNKIAELKKRMATT